AVHSARWFIERQLPRRNPQWLKEMPSPWKSQKGLDLWDGWREGYVHVLTVERDLLSWNLVAAALHAAEAAWEAKQDPEIANWQEGAAKEAHDRLAWMQGRRVAVPETVRTD